MRKLVCFVIATTFKGVCAVKENQQTKGYHSYNPEEHRFEEIYLILRNTMLVAFAPIIFRFLFLVYSDPELPLFRRAFIEMMQSKFGNLSSSTGFNSTTRVSSYSNSKSKESDESSHEEILSDSDDSY